jgi:aldehyde:ferredoxin oxidoreductase
LDPLGVDNILGLTTGPVARTPFPCTSRVVAVGKSPLSGTWGDSNSGGGFGPVLKGAGFDAVFFTGISDTPVYLCIHDGTGELRPAEHIWGLDTVRTDLLVRDECPGRGAQVACIGPAGEALARIAGIVTDGGRIAARCGLGAVMGSKRLKAIAAWGSAKVRLHSPQTLSALRRRVLELIRDPDNPRMVNLQRYGTAGGVVGAVLSNHCPIKNWWGVGARDYPSAENLDGDRVIAAKVRQYRCGGCAVGCGALLSVEMNGQQVEMHRPEYETLAAFGPLTLVDDLHAILRANHTCNLAGLDTISAGASVAFAIECYERGFITPTDTDGIEPRWGDADAMLALLEKMVEREGIGDVLADGPAHAAERIGGDARQCAMAVLGESLPMIDPRLTPGWATTYTTDATPAHHMQGGSALPELGVGPENYIGVPAHSAVNKYDWSGKGQVAAETVKLMHVVNSSGICAFAPIAFDTLIEVINAVTGQAYDYATLLNLGERVAILRQAYNLREGLSPADFALPARACGHPPLDGGPTAGVTVDLERQNAAFYQAMGWDPTTGIPEPDRITAVGELDDVCRDLHGRR